MEEEKNPRSADSNLHSILQKSSNAHEVVAADKNAWQLFKQRLLEEDVKANVGICMIVFALPILIPGVTLTAVAFDDETGFSKYSSLHIIGMIMLGLSVLLVLMGIFLNVSSKSKVSPDDRIRAVSTHEKPLKTLDSEIAGAAHSQGDKSISVKSTHNAASVNFMVESGNTAAGGDHRVHIKVHEVGASSRSGLAFSNPMHKNSPGLRSSDLPCVTSSEDENSSSFNSDDYSHGSYVISEDCDACSQHDAHDVSFPSDKQRIRPKSCLLTSDLRKSQGISKTTTEQKQMSLQNSMLSKSDTILLSGKSLSHQSSNGVNRNNYFTGDTSGSSFAHLGGISESVRGEGRPRTSCLVVRDVDGRYSQASSDKSASSLSPARHNVRFSQPGATSPGTRQRLQGLCIDSIISPSEFTSDSQVEIENNFADTIADTGSCSSVFLNEERHAQDISSRNNSIELKDASQEMTTYSSGYQPEPLAMPIHLRQSSGPVNRNSSPGEEHMASLGACSR